MIGYSEIYSEAVGMAKLPSCWRTGRAAPEGLDFKTDEGYDLVVRALLATVPLPSPILMVAVIR